MQDPSAAAWNPTATVSLEALSQTRQEMHMGALVLGSVAHALIEHLDDDSHANTGVDVAHESLYTHPIRDGVQLHLEFPTQRFVWRAGDEERGELGMVGKSLASVLEGLGGFASELVGREVTIEKREFPDFPDHPVLNGVPFGLRPAGELRELLSWFSNGQSLFDGLARNEPKLSPIRVWPHHFDLGCLLPFGGDAMAGIGLAPGDEHYDEPYFYVSAYPQPEASALPELRHGTWHTAGFIAHVLTATDLQGVEDPGAHVREYLSEALAHARALAKG